MIPEEHQAMYAEFNPDEIEFKLTNKDVQFNCYMNTIIQLMWHVPTLQNGIIEYTKVADDVKLRTREFELLDCIRELFSNVHEKH